MKPMPRPLRNFTLLLLLACGALTAEIRSLNILHVNDLHARLSPLENGNGGFAYLLSAVKHERQGCADCIFLNAGDLVQGTPVSTIYRGEPVFELSNLFGFDAAVLGNHEFDYGWTQARKFLDIAKYPIVTANLVNDRGETLTPKSYVILKVNGLRVAIIGAMTDSLKTLSTPKSLGEWHTVPVVAALRKLAVELRDRSDLIVLLGHIDGPEEQTFLHGAPEIPVLVTGHVHTGIPQAMTYDGRIAVRVKSYGEELGRLELQVDTQKKAPVSFAWKHIDIDSHAIRPDPEMAREVKKWEDTVSAQVDRPLALSKRALNKDQVKALIEEALREATHSDFAWMNSGGVRDILPQGQLLERQIWNIMPFDNDVVLGAFKGKDLPARIAAGRKLEPEREYTLAVSDYTAANQETEENLGTSGLLFPRNVGRMRDLLIDWFRKRKIVE
jgi:2',3'-cyclic-nucleotide 2'-phosphodiesterase (5'-nucleotidase family)